MSENVNHIIVEHLKALRAEIADVKADTSEIRRRLASHDSSIISLHRNDVHLMEEQARSRSASTSCSNASNASRSGSTCPDPLRMGPLQGAAERGSS